jgi:hypothetical protein
VATILPRGETEDRTYTASGDLSACQYHIVKLSAAETAAIAGANDPCLGVLKNAPTAGGQASFVKRGETEVFVDATTAILIGDYIEADGSGHGVKIAATVGSKRYVLGRALEAKASGTGTIIVDVRPGVVTNPAT